MQTPSPHKARARDGWLSLAIIMAIMATACAGAAWSPWALIGTAACAGWLTAHVRAIRSERERREAEAGIGDASAEAAKDAFIFGYLHAKLLTSEHPPTVH